MTGPVTANWARKLDLDRSPTVTVSTFTFELTPPAVRLMVYRLIIDKVTHTVLC